MKPSDSSAQFVQFDDNNLGHVLAGPEYGQPWGEGWTEESTFEFILAERYSFNNFNIITSLSSLA